jgi:quinohemoprotein amine dehydrogenase
MSIARCLRFGCSALLLGLVFNPAAIAADPAAANNDGAALIRSYCSGCHFEHDNFAHDGRFERINTIRKTPEGWVMTIFRMQQVHGLTLNDDVRDRIVQYLSDTQGLAPSEAQPARFALERRPNAQDLDGGTELATMCGRCHSLARPALQRRDADEWLKLVNMHMGQWPSLEYQASGRDRPWWQIASQELPAKLAAKYPFESADWTQWRAQPPQDLSGRWIVVGHEPGGRDLTGTAEITRDGATGYVAHYALTDAGSASVPGESHAIVYTGFEWRGRAQLGGTDTREVFAASADGARIAGRWFEPEHSEVGGDWNAIRQDAAPQVLAVLPRSLRAGTAGVVTVVGTGLAANDALSFGPGVSARVLSRTDNMVRVELTVAADAEPSARTISLGTATGAAAFVVYRQIDRLEVTPAYGIARLGGGKIAPVTAQFEAIAATKLPSGEFLTLGPVAAEWSVQPFDATAQRIGDVNFAGHLDDTGRFHPATAGPNPQRKFSANNTGNLAILAHLKDGDRTLEGRAHLIVTVQRWNTPPIY